MCIRAEREAPDVDAAGLALTFVMFLDGEIG
jgi:hypothetical protein